MSADPVSLVLSIGSIIISVIAGLRCIKSCSGCCFRIEMQDPPPQASDMTTQPPTPPRRTTFSEFIQRKITPRRPTQPPIAPQAEVILT